MGPISIGCSFNSNRRGQAQHPAVQLIMMRLIKLYTNLPAPACPPAFHVLIHLIKEEVGVAQA